MRGQASKSQEWRTIRRRQAELNCYWANCYKSDTKPAVKAKDQLIITDNFSGCPLKWVFISMDTLKKGRAAALEGSGTWKAVSCYQDRGATGVGGVSERSTAFG